MSKLAIVIPAYKPDFLKATLQSVANQSVKDFSLYIGDDCSPHSLLPIIKPFEDKIDIRYHRFDENLGGRDLVAHWERCIDLTNGEPYIWLFSDDDLMDPGCVETFYKNVSPAIDLYRFNVDVIDSDNKTVDEINLPDFISSRDFYIKKINNEIGCFVVEFIFSRKIYEEANHFEKFDLAWGSDIATWINMSFEHGIRTLQGSKIRWRRSGINISSVIDTSIFDRKMLALGDFFKWGNRRFPGDDEVRKVNEKGLVHRLSSMAVYTGPKSGFNAVDTYAADSLADRLRLKTRFGLLYLLKKIRNVFQRSHS